MSTMAWTMKTLLGTCPVDSSTIMWRPIPLDSVSKKLVINQCLYVMVLKYVGRAPMISA